MSRSNTADTANYLNSTDTSGLPTANPITMSCWFYPFNLTSTSALVAISDANATSYHCLLFDGSNAYGLGDNRIIIDNDGVAYGVSSTAVASANTWNHACSVNSGVASRIPYLNGVAGTPETTSRGPSGYNHANVACLRSTTTTFRPIDGAVAEVGIWNAALTDEEVLMLSQGVSPLMVRPNNLARYWPIFGQGTDERDRIIRALLSITGTMATADNPPVFHPSGPIIGKASSGGAGTDALLAEDVTSASTVGTPAIGQAHVLNANDVASASTVGSPAIGQVHALLANDVASASTVGAPALGQVHALLANGVASASAVTAPALDGGTQEIPASSVGGGGGGGGRVAYTGQRALKGYLPAHLARKKKTPAPTPTLIKAVEREIVAEVAPEAPQKPEVQAFVRQEVERVYRPKIDFAALQAALEQISADAAALDQSLRRQAADEAAKVEAARIEQEIEDEDEFLMLAA